jgi:DNA-binding XRE family transcriptional regulator
MDGTIKFYRDKNKLSQQQLADLIEVPRTTMSFYETKRQYPPIEVAEKLAEILKVTIGILYSEQELEVIKTK